MNLFKLFFLNFFIFLSLSSASADGPLELVNKTADDVLSILKSDDSIQNDKEKIYQLAEEKILPNFDLDRISMLVLGKAWRKINQDQQQNFKAEFNQRSDYLER